MTFATTPVMQFFINLVVSLLAGILFSFFFLREHWYSVKKTLPEDKSYFLGYSKEWVDPDYNPEGVRECVAVDTPQGFKFLSAVWVGSHWHTDISTSPTHWRDFPEFK